MTYWMTFTAGIIAYEMLYKPSYMYFNLRSVYKNVDNDYIFSQTKAH